MNRFPELDGFRGFLAVTVMLIHTNIMPIYWMNSGMDCFFTMSAFVITLGLLNAKTTSRAMLLKGFFVRRTARIFPMYYLLLIAIAGLLLVIQWLPASMGLHQYSLKTLIPYFFYLQYMDLYGQTDEIRIWDNQLRFIDHTWSLAVEEQFYVLWGLLFALLQPRRLKLAAAALFIVIGIGARVSGLIVSPLIVYRLDAFGYGILMALLYHEAARTDNWCRLRSYLRICVPVFIAALVIFLVVTDVRGHIAHWMAGQEEILYWHWSPISALTAAGTAALIGILAFGSGSPVLAVLRTRTMRYLGSISYAIYLIHYPVVDVLLNLNHPLLDYGFAINVALTVALVLGLAHFATKIFNDVNRWLIASVGPSPKAPLPPHPPPATPSPSAAS